MTNFYPGQRVLLDIDIIEKGDGPIWDGIGYYESDIQNFIDSQKADQELVIFDTPLGDSIRHKMINVHNTTLHETFWFPRSAVLPYETAEPVSVTPRPHAEIFKIWFSDSSKNFEIYSRSRMKWVTMTQSFLFSPEALKRSYRVGTEYSVSPDDVSKSLDHAFALISGILEGHRTAEELLQDYLTSNNLG
jgi:hypothetical protein